MARSIDGHTFLKLPSLQKYPGTILAGVVASLIAAAFLGVPGLIFKGSETVLKPGVHSRTEVQMLQQIEYDIPAVQHHVYRNDRNIFPIRSNLASRSAEFSIDFIEKLTCSAYVASDLVQVNEPQECFFEFINRNSTGADQNNIPLNWKICHHSAGCVEGTSELIVKD